MWMEQRQVHEVLKAGRQRKMEDALDVWWFGGRRYGRRQFQNDAARGLVG